jgi:hypothetical protein
VSFTLMQAWVAESDPGAAPITVARKPAAGSPPQKRQRKS